MTEENLIKNIQSTDWEFTDSDTQYLTHNIHRYSGKFIPQIAGKAIELLTNPQDTILDSYMGSGTTLLEAALKGRNSIGVDLNPLAVLISKVKTTIITRNDLSELYELLIPFVSRMASGGQISLLEEPFDENLCNNMFERNAWRLVDQWNKKWYQEDVLYQLTRIYSSIEIIKSEAARNIALVAFSDILRKSSNASSKYPNVMFDKNAPKKPLPAKAFIDSLNHVMSCVIEMSNECSNSNTSTMVVLHNNLELPIESNSIDAIISHPPYIAAVPYAEYGSLSLEWFGHNCKELDGKLTGGKRHSKKVVSRFSEDYEKYFVESYRVLKRNHYMFLMVGNPVSHGEKIELDKMTTQFAEKAGFTHITTTIRHGQNRRGNKMGDEYLLFYKKE